MHITASVFINDNESGLHADYERLLEELAPFNAGGDPARGGYLHNRTGEDNADAHHKRQIMGREVVVAITKGELHLGPLGAHLLLRVRRQPGKAGVGEDDWGVTHHKSPARSKGKRRCSEVTASFHIPHVGHIQFRGDS
jgi:hypothetical protein